MSFRLNLGIYHGGQLQGFRCILIAPKFDDEFRGIAAGIECHDDEVLEGSSKAPRAKR